MIQFVRALMTRTNMPELDTRMNVIIYGIHIYNYIYYINDHIVYLGINVKV